MVVDSCYLDIPYSSIVFDDHLIDKLMMSWVSCGNFYVIDH